LGGGNFFSNIWMYELLFYANSITLIQISWEIQFCLFVTETHASFSTENFFLVFQDAPLSPLK
jgi:hypothetical protein